LDSTGSGYGTVASYCECGYEPSGSCATKVVNNPLDEVQHRSPASNITVRNTTWAGVGLTCQFQYRPLLWQALTAMARQANLCLSHVNLLKCHA
jgi:hypothetical protein